MSNKEKSSGKQMAGDIMNQMSGKVQEDTISKFPGKIEGDVISNGSIEFFESMVGSLDMFYRHLNSELYVLNQNISKERWINYNNYIMNPMDNYFEDFRIPIDNIQGLVTNWQTNFEDMSIFQEQYNNELLDSKTISMIRNFDSSNEQLIILINKLDNMENNQRKIYELINEYIELDSETNEKLNKLLLDIKENTSEDKIVGKIKSETESLIISNGVKVGLAFIFKAIFNI